MRLNYRPFVVEDLSLLKQWIASPHWQEWWGEPETEISYIRDMLAEKDTTRPFIFDIDGEDIGYIQYWFIADQVKAGWSKEEKWLEMVPEDSIGVDLSIGPIERLENGLGSAILNRFTLDLEQKGYQTILIDPDINNARAIRAYEKAGYKAIEDLLGETGDSLIMQFETKFA